MGGLFYEKVTDILQTDVVDRGFLLEEWRVTEAMVSKKRSLCYVSTLFWSSFAWIYVHVSRNVVTRLVSLISTLLM